MYYKVCPICGAHLDPGEPCDCKNEKKRVERKYQSLIKVDESNQLALNLEELYEETTA